MDTDKYILYTDGSCLKNPGGPGGWGAVVLKDGIVTAEISAAEKSTTSNRMEIMGAIKGLRAIPKESCVEVYSDSTYLVNCANQVWNRNKNLDLWKKLDKEIRRHKDVYFMWVKGHSGNEYNTRADKLANNAARRVAKKL